MATACTFAGNGVEALMDIGMDLLAIQKAFIRNPTKRGS
jgi:hypothetical protein